MLLQESLNVIDSSFTVFQHPLPSLCPKMGNREGTGQDDYDYIDNLSPSFSFWLGLGLGLKLRFVKIGVPNILP